MIALQQIWKSHGSGRKRRDVLKGIDALLDPSSSNIGILGARQAGKSTLLAIVAGLSPADSGKVSRRATISWPLSWRGFGKGMTGDSQVCFLSRAYRRDRRETLRFVAELSGLGAKLYQSTRHYSAREKDRLMFAAALAMDFDLYLIDDALPPIEPEHANNYNFVWQERMRSRRALLATARTSHATNFCGQCAILEAGQLSPLMATEDAAQFYAAANRQRNQPG